eukprot:2776940-Rhodomonas_salina.1
MRQLIQPMLQLAIALMTYLSLATLLFLAINLVKNLPQPVSPGQLFSPLPLILLVLTTFPGAAMTTNNVAFYGAFSTNSSTMDSYLIDSRCTMSIIADPQLLSDFRRVHPVTIQGLTGDKTYDWTATLTLPIRTIHGDTHLL